MGKKFDAGTAELVWHGDYPPSILERVRTDIAEELTSLSKASDLVFHHVFLSDNYLSGPIVTVWGERRDKRLHCEYSETVEWVTASSEADI